MKISDKLTKVDTDVTINKYDNGFVVHFAGHNGSGDWTNAKILCSNLEELITLLKEYDKMAMT
jgi:adenylylsulfate kinase-like enzyme